MCEACNAYNDLLKKTTLAYTILANKYVQSIHLLFGLMFLLYKLVSIIRCHFFTARTFPAANDS